MILAGVVAEEKVSGGGGGGGGPALVSHTAAGAAYPNLTITTSAINTTGANFIVIVGESDGHANATLSDSYGNTWVLRTSNDAMKPNIWSCFNPTVGAGHTFTLAHTADASCGPSLAVAAFSGIVAGTFQTADSYAIAGGVTAGQAGVVNPRVGDLCIVGIGAGRAVGVASATIDSGFTITDQIDGPAYNWTAVALAYLFYVSPVIQIWSSATTYPQGAIVQRSGQNYRALFNGTNHDPALNDGWWTAPGVEAAGNVAPQITVPSYGNGWSPVIASFAAAPAAVAFVKSVTAQDGSFSPSLTTSAIDTTGANFLVAILSAYDGNAVHSITDNKGNTWHLASIGSGPWSYDQRHAIYYAYNATCGTGHTFTVGATGGSGDGCPGICLMAFSGMPITDPHEAYSGSQPWNQSNGPGPIQATIDPQSPLHVGDLVITGISGTQKTGTLTLDSGFTIAGTAAPAAYIGVGGGYKIATSTGVHNPTWGNFPTSGINNSTLVIFSKT